MAKARSYQRYPAHFKRMALEKAAEDGMTVALLKTQDDRYSLKVPNTNSVLHINFDSFSLAKNAPCGLKNQHSVTRMNRNINSVIGVCKKRYTSSLLDSFNF